MKTRRGFVSNSSSSSFIVGFPRTPESPEELQKMLFGEEKRYFSPYPGIHDEGGWSTESIAELVWMDLQNPHGDGTPQIPATPDNLTAMVEHGGYFLDMEGAPNFDSFRDKKGHTDWDAYSKACNDHADNMKRKFAEANPDAVFFEFEYSDNDGDIQSAMEHGDLFDRLPHLRISHH